MPSSSLLQPPVGCLSLPAGRSSREVPGDCCCAWQGSFAPKLIKGTRREEQGLFAKGVSAFELDLSSGVKRKRGSAVIRQDQYAVLALAWLISAFLSTIQTNSKLRNPFSFPARPLSKGAPQKSILKEFRTNKNKTTNNLSRGQQSKYKDSPENTGHL